MDKKYKKHWFIAGGIAIAVFACTAISYVRLPSGNKSNAAWMKSLSDGTSLSRISLPGTHDSGATLSLLDSAGKCQDTSIAEQLNFGARFLDIRLKSVGDQLSLYHGFIDQELTFSKVLAECYDFLTRNPSETIIMSVQEETKSSNSTKSFETLLNEAIAPKKDDYWLTSNSVPTLGQARGKIVLLSRYTDPTMGIDCGKKDTWKVSQTFDMNNGVPFHIQDTYLLKDNETKWTEATNCFGYASSISSDPFIINFLSGYLDKKVGPVNFAIAAPTAKYINPLAQANISKYSFTGIVLFDFMTPELASAVIGVNK